MENQTCQNCKFFYQHYGLDGKKIFRLQCGHCAHPHLRNRKPCQKACVEFVQGENKEKELISMAKYKVRINSQVTIFEEEVVSVEADNEWEAREEARDAFKERMDAKYGWCDYDTTNIEECVKCQ